MLLLWPDFDITSYNFFCVKLFKIQSKDEKARTMKKVGQNNEKSFLLTATVTLTLSYYAEAQTYQRCCHTYA